MTYKSNCFVCDTTFEWQSPRMTADNPPCPECGGPTERGYYPIAAVWTKNIAAYSDRNVEGYHKQQKDGGFWTMEHDKETGKVSRCFIDSPQKNSEYCKRNGLLDPKSLPSNLKVAADGQSYEKTNVSEI